MDLDPTTSAVLTMEMQRGVCGDLAAIPALRDAMESTGAARQAGRVVSHARSNGVPVVHCTFSLTADRVGSPIRLPMMAIARNDPAYLLDGTAACDVLPELDRQPGDLSCNRHHGMTPFTGTGLDAMLRDLGVETVIAVGVSLNVGIIGLTIEAVNLGYDVVVVRDAVVGVPVEYGEAVLHNALRPIARLVTADDLVYA
jgi:nicotinamidase-related amidase